MLEPGRCPRCRHPLCNVPTVTAARAFLQRLHTRLMLQAVYNWGPRYASALRKRWTIFKNPQADIRFLGSAYLGPGFSFYAPAGGTFIVGSGTEFRKGFRVEIAHGGRVEIGARCVFSYYSVIQCSTSIKVGDRAMFGQASIIVDGNHQLRDISTDIFAQPYDYRAVVIANDVTTLTKCTILNSIGTKSIVAANAVVDKAIPPYCTYGGVPARILNYFGPPELEPPEWTRKRQEKGIPDPEPRPNTLEITGHSLPFGGGVTAFPNRFTTLLAELMDATEVNRSVAGALLCWPQTGSSPGDGGYAHVLQALRRPDDINARLPETLTGLTYYGTNDLALLGPAGLTPFASALRMTISRHRAASVFEESHASVTYTGDWTARAAGEHADCSGTGVTVSAGADAALTIAVPDEFPGGTIALGFVAEPGGGALHVVSVDGRETARLDTRGITAADRRCGAVLRLEALAAGAHEIRCTVAEGTTAFDYWQVEQSPLVLVPLAYEAADWSPYTGWAHQPAAGDIAALNVSIRAVADEFGPGVVCVETQDAVADALHTNGFYPGDEGHAAIARALQAVVSVQKTGVSV